MGRLYWKRTLVSSVAWAGLALGQSPSATSPRKKKPLPPRKRRRSPKKQSRFRTRPALSSAVCSKPRTP